MKIKAFFIILGSLIFLFLTQWVLPWWSSAVILFLIGLFFIRNGWTGFSIGWIVLFILWIGTAIYQSNGAEVSVANGIGELLGGLPGIAVYIITGILGGAIGGMAAMTGALASKVFLK